MTTKAALWSLQPSAHTRRLCHTFLLLQNVLVINDVSRYETLSTALASGVTVTYPLDRPRQMT